MDGAAQDQGQLPNIVSRGRRSIRVAGERKFETYGELAQALQQLYYGAEWRVEIPPWVVGDLESGVSWTLLVLAVPWSCWTFPYKTGRA